MGASALPDIYGLPSAGSSVPPPFGEPRGEFSADRGTGSLVGPVIARFNELNGGLIVPRRYVSGSDLGISTATWLGQSFASLGMLPGTYVTSWGPGGATDSLTINIGASANPIPEPATWLLMLMGFGSIGSAVRHSRKTNVVVSYA